MTDKEQFQAYSTLSEQLYTQFHHRRELEWRIHVAIWTLLAAAGYLLVSQKICLGHLRPVPLFALFVMVPILHFLWCVKIQIPEFRSRHLSREYRLAAERILTDQQRGEGRQLNTLIDSEENRQDDPHPWIQKRFESNWWWLMVEVGTTLLLTTAVVYFAW